MALRQELEALEAVLAAGRHKGEWSTDAALSLCRRAVEAEDRTDKILYDELGTRDLYHEWADRLADAICPGGECGEHTSCNNPWASAEEFAAQLHADLARLRSRLTQAEGLLREEAEESPCERWPLLSGPRCGQCWYCRTRAFLAHDDKDRASGAESEASDEAL